MNKILKEILSTSIYLLVVLIFTIVIVKYVAQSTQVLGDSMEPTLIDKDYLIVDKLSYNIGEPKRFDIVLFPFKYEKRTYYIKRIIGLPGETVYIDDNGNIYINDKILHESYGNAVILKPGLAANKLCLGEDEYFVLGDNRNNSCDSRDPSVGIIKRDKIVGKALFRFWPVKSIKIVK